MSSLTWMRTASRLSRPNERRSCLVLARAEIQRGTSQRTNSRQMLPEIPIPLTSRVEWPALLGNRPRSILATSFSRENCWLILILEPWIWVKLIYPDHLYLRGKWNIKETCVLFFIIIFFQLYLSSSMFSTLIKKNIEFRSYFRELWANKNALITFTYI